MEQKIVGFHQDEEQHWVAELECGHNQHVRHDPPWTNRPWVITPEGRAQDVGAGAALPQVRQRRAAGLLSCRLSAAACRRARSP